MGIEAARSEIVRVLVQEVFEPRSRPTRSEHVAIMRSDAPRKSMRPRRVTQCARGAAGRSSLKETAVKARTHIGTCKRKALCVPLVFRHNIMSRGS